MLIQMMSKKEEATPKIDVQESPKPPIAALPKTPEVPKATERVVDWARPEASSFRDDAGYLSQINDFDGNLDDAVKDVVEWKDYFARFENLSRCAGWNEERKKHLTSKLTGRALTFQQCLEKTFGDQPMTYAELVSQIEERFAKKIPLGSYKMLFNACKQEAGEEPGHFAERLEDLYELAFPPDPKEKITAAKAQMMNEQRDKRLN